MGSRHKPKNPGRDAQTHRGKCPECGKLRYPDRKSAKRAARYAFPGDSMRAYQCGEWWHFTSQNAEVVTWYREHGREGLQENK